MKKWKMFYITKVTAVYCKTKQGLIALSVFLLLYCSFIYILFYISYKYFPFASLYVCLVNETYANTKL